MQEVKLGPLSASDPKTAPMGSKPPDFAEAKRKVRAWKETLAKKSSSEGNQQSTWKQGGYSEQL